MFIFLFFPCLFIICMAGFLVPNEFSSHWSHFFWLYTQPARHRTNGFPKFCLAILLTEGWSLQQWNKDFWQRFPRWNMCKKVYLIIRIRYCKARGTMRTWPVVEDTLLSGWSYGAVVYSIPLFSHWQKISILVRFDYVFIYVAKKTAPSPFKKCIKNYFVDFFR